MNAIPIPSCFFFYSKVDSTFAFTISLVTTGESSVEDFPVFYVLL